ncbi:MAG: carotenoid biosynthesis protein [Bacteroidales bacterium]|nr:carotenoid biosynthesis protein [Bacteroidales bacterium]
MKRFLTNIRHNKTVQIIVILLLAFFLYLMGFIGMIEPESRAESARLTPLTLILSLLVVMLFAEASFTIRTVLVFLAIAVAGYLIEAAGVNTGRIFGSYTYGKTLGLRILNTPVIIGLNWLFLVYASSSVFEKYPLHNTLKILLASLVMLVYDFILEPAAPKMDMWHWKNSAVPIQNYIAWFAIAVVFHSIIRLYNINTRNPVAPWILSCQFLFFLALNIFLK